MLGSRLRKLFATLLGKDSPRPGTPPLPEATDDAHPEATAAAILAERHPIAILRRAWVVNRPLTFMVVMLAGVLVVALVGLIVDPRVITGQPAWMKPVKFAISGAVYAFSLLLLLTFVRGHQRMVSIISTTTAIAFSVELAIIIGQVIRGTMSHFNYSTPLDATLFSIMGAFIMLVWLGNLAAAILLLVQRMPDRALAWSLRLGLILALIGAGLGMPMTRPTPEQAAQMAAGQPVAIIGAHSVGVPDGGPGLPVLGWSTEGGDLRSAHFVGLHGLQALPLLGWWLTRRRRWSAPWQPLALVWIGGLTYGGIVAVVTWQALRGQPLLAPDITTITAYGAVLGAGALATLGTLALGRTSRAASHPLQAAPN